MDNRTKIIIQEEFVSNTYEERKRILNELLIRLIRKSEILNR